MQWQLNSKISLGGSIQNILPIYKHKIDYLQNANTQKGLFHVPINYTLAASFITSKGEFSIDNQLLKGKYGGRSTKNMSFWLIRVGWEYPLPSSLLLRSGILLPLKLTTSSLGDLTLPPPGFDLTVGIGYRWDILAIDVAFYGDPGQSYVSHQAKLGMMFSLSLNY